MATLRRKIFHLQELFANYFSSCFLSRRKTFKLIALFIFSALFIIQVGIILINNSFYTNFSDDILQYYTIMVDFIASIKGGTLSVFNLNNYFGASFFSDIYYIPLDIFTFITFGLSYIMPTEIAYSITELLKIFMGVMALAYYFHLKGMKNRTIFWMSIFYFVSGGMVSFMAFPVFLSIIFYMPLSLVVIHFFFNKKRWMVPVFALLIVFYDFYLAYMLLAFLSFAFIIEYFKREGFRLLTFLKDGIIFLSLLILGVMMAGVILLPSIAFILEETYRSQATFNAWIVNIGSYELKLFQPEIYIRYLAKIVAEQKPIGFYGFEDDYGLEHISLYITVIGFVYMCNIFFMKDRISRVYKISFLIALIFMIFPLFSYVFSGTFDKPYTRWINLLPMIQVMALAHVFDQYGFEKVKMKHMTITISLLLLLVGFLLYFYITKLSIDVRYAGRDTLTADAVLIGVSAIYLVILLIFGWLKKFTVIKWFIWIEVIIAIGYVYSGPFSIRNKIDTFETMHNINDFLEENLEKDEFYRVYVDLSRFDVEKTNFNRITVFATNTYIFHSWTDAETNAISKMLFNSNEYQSKQKMDYFGYYINHFLGYKYVLVNSEDNFVFDDEYFTFIASEDIFSLYEINYSSSFRVFDSYFNDTDSDGVYGNSLSDLNSALIRQKTFLMAAIIDDDKDYDMSQYDLDYLDNPDNRTSTSLSPYKKISSITTESTTGIYDDIQRIFYVYDEETLDINFTAGAMYLKFDDSLTKIDDLDEVYMEFGDGTKQICQIYNSGLDETETNAPYNVKCEFWKRPVKIYLEDTDNIDSGPVFKMRTERAIDFAAYLEYDLSNINLPSEEGMILFDMTIDKGFDKLFVVDENGNVFECLDGYYYYNSKPDKIYIFKTNSMYNYYDLYNLRLRYFVEDNIDIDNILNQDNISSKYLQIKKGKINLSYVNVIPSDSDQVVVIPIAYSDDWEFTSSETYDTISVSGGFLGIVVPKGATSIDINMEFVPKYLDLGFYITLGATSIYALIFLIPIFVRKKKRG
ncbi:MAG: YfhO family protein [Candidatus Izemoplasmatales bacterium]|nr:YfhO family protein [Candidatus Izemoplasmatales bacterium]